MTTGRCFIYEVNPLVVATCAGNGWIKNQSVVIKAERQGNEKTARGENPGAVYNQYDSIANQALYKSGTPDSRTGPAY